MSVIDFSRVSFSHTSQPLLTDVSFTCSGGERICVVGSTGTGKSTLLDLATGRLTPEDGTVTALRRRTPAGGTVGELLDDAFAGGVGGVRVLTSQPTALLPQLLPRRDNAPMTDRIWTEGVGNVGRGFVHPTFWATPVPELSAGNQHRMQPALALRNRPTMLLHRRTDELPRRGRHRVRGRGPESVARHGDRRHP